MSQLAGHGTIGGELCGETFRLYFDGRAARFGSGEEWEHSRYVIDVGYGDLDDMIAMLNKIRAVHETS